MFKFLLFLAVLKLVVGKFDPSKIDYCKIACDRWDVSSGCNCVVEAQDRTYVTDDMQRFRQLVLDKHNDHRNNVAKGEFNFPTVPTAANMHILQYDLELEHLARCFVMGANYFTRGVHDKCRQTSYCNSSSMPGQNMASLMRLDADDMAITMLIYKWYNEVETLINDKNKTRTVINKFVLSDEYRHFTQLIWATTEKVGCARASIPRNPDPNIYFVLVCNYAGPPDNCAGNVPGQPVYLVGRPCSKCGDTKCNTDLGGKFDALCGLAVEAPDEAPATDLEFQPNAGTMASSEAPDETTTQYWKGDGSTGSRNFTNKFFIVFIVIFEILYH